MPIPDKTPRPSAPVVGYDRVTGVPLCEHGDDAEACQLAHRKPAAADLTQPRPFAIAVTPEMRSAFLAENDDTCDQVGCGRADCLDARLTAALAVVEMTLNQHPSPSEGGGRLMGYLNPHTHDRDNQGPKIVTICGSTRFRAEIAQANRMLTLAGHMVLAPGVFAHDGDEITEEQKAALDALHFKKIDLARWIYVVNPGGYIGESTRREIEYARRTGKGVLTLVDAGVDGWSPEAQAEAAVSMAAKRAELASTPNSTAVRP